MPTIEIAGKQIETTEMGYLVNAEDWSEDLAKAIADIEKLQLSGSEIRISGCAALDLAWVASGRTDAYLDKIDSFEHSAGIILVREAGGFCTDFSMAENMINKKEICAANPSMHNNVIKIIRTT